MYCSNCGAQSPDDAMFCPACGVTRTTVRPEPRVSTGRRAVAITGWVLMVPFAVLGALCSLGLTIALGCAVLGVVPWHTVLEYLVATVVLGILAIPGRLMVAWGTPDMG